MALGKTPALRQAAYQALFNAHLDAGLAKEISHAVNAGVVLGNDQFKADVAKLLGRRVTPLKRGRPAKMKKPDDDISLV